MDLTGWSRKKTAAINIVLMILLSLPCVLGFNVWSGFQPFGAGSNVLDLEDFLVSNIWLPLGSLVYLLFCTVLTRLQAVGERYLNSKGAQRS